MRILSVFIKDCDRGHYLGGRSNPVARGTQGIAKWVWTVVHTLLKKLATEREGTDPGPYPMAKFPQGKDVDARPHLAEKGGGNL
jgi:hypothetical protein